MALNNKIIFALYGRCLVMYLNGGGTGRQCKFHAPSLPLVVHKLLAVYKTQNTYGNVTVQNRA